jgi:uncharacterized ubiquitin-like protein YukD
MEKVLVTLVVPSLGKKYDVLLPVFLTVSEIVPLLTEALVDLTGKSYVTSGNEFLCSSEKQIIFNQSYTINECGIQNGDMIYLF